MENIGYISCRMKYTDVGPRTIGTVEFVEWDGPPVAMILSGYLRQLPHSGDLYELGPYIVRDKGHMVWSDSHIVERVDSFTAPFHLCKFRFMQGWQVFFTRLVVTLAVWNLAKMPSEGSIATLSDIWKRWK